MFFRLRRFFSLHRRRIILVIAVVIFILLVIRIANSLVAQNAENRRNNTQANAELYEAGSRSPNVLHTETTISGENLEENTATENQEIIKNFIQACNDGDVNTAYSYLSKSCINKVFPTIDDFTNKYYNAIFTEKKDYNIENWISSVGAYTYRIYYVSDILSSGVVSDNIEDYITVVDEDRTKKLNIFRYIYNEQINASEENDVAKIELIDKDTYDDYEVYNVKVTNKSNNTIMLNRYEDNDGIYVEYAGSDEKYGAFITEIYEGNLTIEAGQTKYVSIEINKIYRGISNQQKLVFSDIINNKDVFDTVSDKTAYADKSVLEIDC